MRILFLIGSLTVGATLAIGLFQIPVLWRVGLLIAAVMSLIVIRSTKRRCVASSSRVAYIVDKESERYSGDDVAEFFQALSQAKANSTAPFYSSATHRLEDRRH